jgi:hypothetical protein
MRRKPFGHEVSAKIGSVALFDCIFALRISKPAL